MLMAPHKHIGMLSLDMPSLLMVEQSLGLQESRKLSHCLLLNLNMLLQHMLQKKLYGSEDLLKRSLDHSEIQSHSIATTRQLFHSLEMALIMQGQSTSISDTTSFDSMSRMAKSISYIVLQKTWQQTLSPRPYPALKQSILLSPLDSVHLEGGVL